MVKRDARGIEKRRRILGSVVVFVVLVGVLLMVVL